MNNPPATTAYKLFRLRRDGSIGPLFINARQRIPYRKWLPAEDHPTPGFAHRPGWHVSRTPEAPHLKPDGRIWCVVEIREFKELLRPPCQGGVWLLANWMRVLHPITRDEIQAILSP